MTPEIRDEVLCLIEKATNYLYPLRWVDEKTTTGDFDGREAAIDVFFIPSSNQIDFLAWIRPIRGLIREMTGHRCIFIFHSPEATITHYSYLFPVTSGVPLVKGGGIKLPLPSPGGTESKPVIISSPQYDIKDIREAA
ncbi:MAG: hypothetical protein AB1478_00105 [Nitrospirota bacterium]